MNAAPPPPGGVSSIKLALLAKETRAQAGQVLHSDPVAVIGAGCRVPGGATNADEMWRLLRSGAHGVGDVPADRWDMRDWYDPDPAAPGKSITKQASFLDQIDMFDSGYFGILPREADRMDPQQRILLEVAIEALDDAGLPHPQLRGSRTSVYIASYHNDYGQLQYSDPDGIEARTLTGTLHSIVPNRLSFLLDLRGPSMSIDSACSSSLVAIHLGMSEPAVGRNRPRHRRRRFADDHARTHGRDVQSRLHGARRSLQDFRRARGRLWTGRGLRNRRSQAPVGRDRG